MIPQKKIKIESFNYNLPNNKIALFPLAERDISKLLVYKNNNITDTKYKNISDFLPLNSILIFNNTKVIPARLIFNTSSGVKIEIFCLEQNYEITDNENSQFWNCFVGRLKKWKNEILTLKRTIDSYEFILQAKKCSYKNGVFIVKFNWYPNSLTFYEILEIFGKTPLPPYINRQEDCNDKERYQTIFAKYSGSVAAPTAGLHFTDHIFHKLKQKQINFSYITLHVGAGTFKPVSTEDIGNHYMHFEWIQISYVEIQNIIDKKKQHQPIFCVGTTSLRTIESLYYIGKKIKKFSKHDFISVLQWEPYEIDDDKFAIEYLQNIINWMEKHEIYNLIAKTQLMIIPGYKLKISSGLITNFHQPKSTLLLLISAVVGNSWKKIYEHALQNNYRFLSYGDGCLLFNHEIV